MTYKQIIIDGVDVSGCSCHYNGWSQLYRDNRDMCDKGYDLECKPKENGCYHYTKCLEEQLKAKEQECERLMEETTLALRLGNDILRLFEVSEYDWLADQNEIIDIFRAYKMETEEGKEINAELKAENKHLNDLLNQALKEYEKAMQTLTEIKELLKDICIEECCFDWNKTNKKHCGDCDCRFMQLLEKISECEGNYETN